MDYRILFIAPAAALVLSISTASAQLPVGWQPYSNAMAPNPDKVNSFRDGYEIGTDPASNALASRVLTIRSTLPQTAPTPRVGAAGQTAYGYAGQRVRFSGQVRGEGVRHWGGLYLGVGGDMLLGSVVIGEPGVEQHLPMGANVGAGSTGWQDVSVVIDVPADAESINLGLALVGEGQVWARGLRFETVGVDVPVSSTPIAIDWAQAREEQAQARRMMSQIPPQPLANATLD
jgi:hypothetical protein